MSAPFILGGIQVPLHAGAPEVNYAPAGGATDVILSGGTPVRMRHFKKQVITITGSGWMATGLDALDWDAYHLLLCPRPKRMATSGLQVTLSADARPDVPVAAQALVGRDWVSAPVSVEGRVVTITPVAGAAQYSVVWYPQFEVLCTPPPEDSAGDRTSWQIICREK